MLDFSGGAQGNVIGRDVVEGLSTVNYNQSSLDRSASRFKACYTRDPTAICLCLFVPLSDTNGVIEELLEGARWDIVTGSANNITSMIRDDGMVNYKLDFLLD